MQLSKIGGGVAVNLSKLRGRGETIKGVEGAAKGIMPVLSLWRMRSPMRIKWVNAKAQARRITIFLAGTLWSFWIVRKLTRMRKPV